MKASTKYLKISYKKMNVVAGLVRRKSVPDALAFLKFAPKKAADLLYKIISSAAANAEQSGAKKEDLVVEKIMVTKGALYKRHRPVSRGRAHPYRKATSHCQVELQEVKEEKPKEALGKAVSDTAKKPAVKRPKSKPDGKEKPSSKSKKVDK